MVCCELWKERPYLLGVGYHSITTSKPRDANKSMNEKKEMTRLKRRAIRWLVSSRPSWTWWSATAIILVLEQHVSFFIVSNVKSIIQIFRIQIGNLRLLSLPSSSPSSSPFSSSSFTFSYSRMTYTHVFFQKRIVLPDTRTRLSWSVILSNVRLSAASPASAASSSISYVLSSLALKSYTRICLCQPTTKRTLDTTCILNATKYAQRLVTNDKLTTEINGSHGVQQRLST